LAEFFTKKSEKGNPSIHLGMDIFLYDHTPIFSPLDGWIYELSFQPGTPYDSSILIITHKGENGDVFYTLYKNLNQESLSGFRVGQFVKKGEKIGSIERFEHNNGLPTHLHIQLISDLLELGNNFPEYCHASEQEIWTQYAMDPNLIVQIPESIFPRKTTSKTVTLGRRKDIIGRNVRLSYCNPLKIVRGWMQYLFDETGRIFIDGYNNVPHVGHCHPKIVETTQSQMRILNTNTRYLNDIVNEYAEKLLGTLPSPLEVCFFVNSGSEANELAIRLSRVYTQSKDLIVLENAYHGNTTTLIDISPYKHNGRGGSGPPHWVHTVPIPDTYRGLYREVDPKAAAKYAYHVRELLQVLEENGVGLAGFIAETCPSVGGQLILPEGYLAQVYSYVRASGGVCIADEVQTGYGRLGSNFYAFEDHGVIPDIVALGKPIGNGHPLGAVITTREIADAFDNGMEFFSTFGGNTVSCAVGLDVLNIVQEEGLQNHAYEVGKHLINGLNRLKNIFPMIGDVRGSGLFLGVELVRDIRSLEPAKEEANTIINRMREMGILIGTDGPYNNVLKIRPPMPFSKDNADILLNTLEDVLYEDFSL